MTRVNCDGSGWTIIAETVPSGVTSVTHTGCEDYDWIVAEFSEVETSSSGLVSMDVGYGSTPTYAASFYIRCTTANSQFFNATEWYPEGTARTVDRRAAWSIPNICRRENNGSLFTRPPTVGAGYSTPTNSPGSMVGLNQTLLEPITAIKYTSSAGNLQGSGSYIRTWGWRG